MSSAHEYGAEWLSNSLVLQAWFIRLPQKSTPGLPVAAAANLL